MIKTFSKKLLLIGIPVFFMLTAAPQDSYAQEKRESKYEKMQKKSIEWNRRRIKGEQAKSNKKQRRSLKYQIRGNQGDRPYESGRGASRVRKRIPSSSTPAVHAQPDPYAFSKNSRRGRIYSNDNLKVAPRRTASPWKGSNKTKSTRIESQTAGRINVFPQPDPYSFRKQRSERQRMSRNQDFIGSTPRATERTSKRKRVAVQSASGRYTVRKREDPYKLREKSKWEKTYTGGFYGRREGIRPQNTQRVSGFESVDPYSNRGRKGDKPYSGEIAGGFGIQPRNNQKAWKGDIAGKKIRAQSQRTRRINVFPSVNPYGNRLGRSERDRISRDQESYGTTPRSTERASKRGRVKIRSASGRYIVNKKAKPYKLKDVKEWEETYTGGFYGRREDIKPLNTQRVSTFISPNPYKNRGRMGDKPYKGAISGGGLLSATKRGERAWKGDIAGRRINYSKPRDTQQSGDRFGRSAASQTATGGLHNNNGRAITSSGAGGSVSARMNRNNSGKAVMSFVPGKSARETSVHEGNKYLFEIAPGFHDGHVNYQGDLKARRPLKGGGTITRNDWNNKGQALPKRYQNKEALIPGNFSGTAKASKPLQGGGSVTRKDWNNNGQALAKKYQNKETLIPGSFSGSMKASKPAKGGGSITRNDWNNNARALPKKYTGKEVTMIGGFSGTTRTSKPVKANEKSNTRESWNNNEQSTGLRIISPTSYYSSRHQGDIKEKSKYARNKNMHEDALKSRTPNKSYFAGGTFQGNVKRGRRKIDGQLHASTKFYNSRNEDNATEEKKKFISFKILWQKLFGKETPEKEKEKKPRYDRGEKDIWND